MNRRAFFNLALLCLASTKASKSWSIDSGSYDNEKINGAEFSNYKQKHSKDFDNYRLKLKEEFEQFKKISQKETEKFRTRVAKRWDQPEISSQKIWIEYSSDLSSRKKVDFENGTIQISTLSQVDVENNLKLQLTNTLKANQIDAFKSDQLAQNIEKSIKKSLTLVETATPEPTPILLPYISDMLTRGIDAIDNLVNEILSKSTKTVVIDSRGQKVTTIEIPLQVKPSDDLSHGHTPNTPTELKKKSFPKGAISYSKDVVQYSSKYKLSSALIYSVIETESAFNPMAKSPIPAFGLMQIVPESAGMDATEFLLGKAKLLTPSYLYSSKKNIEIGAIYLHLLNSRYLKDIKNSTSRLYCVISAYNTGPGNVAKAFTGKMVTKTAIAKINSMRPGEVYDHLLKSLPYKETRSYLKKVVASIDKYA